RKYQEKKLRERRSEERRRERETRTQIPPANTGVRHKMPELSDEVQEKDIIRILLQYGQQSYQDEHEEEITVAENVLMNINDVKSKFENALYLKVINIFEEHFTENKEILDFQYFIQHEDDKL